ncbi:ROK family protein [bacterium]|nr:ROK family protein [bacterium]
MHSYENSYSVGIDLGGTKSACGLCSKEKIVKKKVIPTDAFREPSAILESILEVALDLMEDIDRSEIAGVGVGAPGQLDPVTNTVVYAPNLNWKNVPLGDWLSKKLFLPVKVVNDVRSATMAEFRYGAGKGLTDFVNIFVGTGIGSGLVSNGKLLEGFSNSAGEIGHICLDPNGPTCGCGKRGCLEAFSSGKGLENFVKNKLSQGFPSSISDLVAGDFSKVTGKVIGAAAKEKDKLAIEALERVGKFLGIAFANIHTFLNPQTILIGGGLMALREFILPALDDSIRKHILPVANRPELFKPATFENDAVVIGSGALFS